MRVVNLVTHRLVRCLGGPENLRFLQVALLPARSAVLQSATAMALLGMDSATASLEMHAALEEPPTDFGAGGSGGNATGSSTSTPHSRDPVIVCTAFKKNRVYLFTNHEPHEIKSEYVNSHFITIPLPLSFLSFPLLLCATPPSYFFLISFHLVPTSYPSFYPLKNCYNSKILLQAFQDLDDYNPCLQIGTLSDSVLQEHV